MDTCVPHRWELQERGAEEQSGSRRRQLAESALRGRMPAKDERRPRPTDAHLEIEPGRADVTEDDRVSPVSGRRRQHVPSGGVERRSFRLDLDRHARELPGGRDRALLEQGIEGSDLTPQIERLAGGLPAGLHHG